MVQLKCPEKRDFIKVNHKKKIDTNQYNDDVDDDNLYPCIIEFNKITFATMIYSSLIFSPSFGLIYRKYFNWLRNSSS